ncbi:MAG: single-stranded DNA-binding protein [Saprospiraceae bacterium]
MNSIRNQVQLIGHLGKNPELKSFENDKKVVRFSLATNENYKDQKGEKQTITQWHNVIAWGKIAEHIHKMTQKGSEIAIQGKLTYRKYLDNSGAEKYITEVVAQEFFKIGGKSEVSQPK